MTTFRDTIEHARIESDERGFELHLQTGSHTYILNFQQIAEDLWDEFVKDVGPWLLEKGQARREFLSQSHRYCPDAEGLCVVRGYEDECPNIEQESGPWPGESAADYFRRTGDDGPLRDWADGVLDDVLGPARGGESNATEGS